MSVLSCPVCQGAMREVARGGVLIDTCTRCRGVWLDRGELEKLSALVDDGPAAGSGSFLGISRPSHSETSRYPGRYSDDDDDRRDQWRGKPPKSKMAKFLDFFD